MTLPTDIEFNNTGQPGKILVVDDTPENVGLLGQMLEAEGYEISTAPNGEIGLEIARSFNPDLILLDIMMPVLDGFDTCQALKKNRDTRDIPVIFISALNDVQDIIKGFGIGGLDYIVKPFRREEVLARVQTHIRLYNLMKEREELTQVLEEKVYERTRELQETRLEVIQCLGRAGEYRDNETGMHVVRLSHFAARLGKELGMPKDQCNLLFHASPMHDIGKIGIPDKILLKPGKLESDEWEIMQSHVTIGAEILSRDESPLMKMARLVALHHHEKWDGSGYPNQLKGEEISLEGRVIAVCDVFDALTSERPYKKAWPLDKTLVFLENGKDQHFEGRIVKAFQSIVPDIMKIREEFKDE